MNTAPTMQAHNPADDNKRPRSEAGFTLIELMLIAFIVSLLAVIALPVYQDYSIRSKVSEGMAMMGEAKTRISVYYATNTRMPSTASQAALETNIDTDIVASITYDGDQIVLHVKDIGGDTGTNNTLQFSLKSTSSGTPEWTCKQGDSNPLKTSYMPPVCR